MDPDVTLREIVKLLGKEAYEIFENLGVAVDDWGMDLTVQEICDEHDLELEEVVEALEATGAWDDDDDDEDDDEDDDDEFEGLDLPSDDDEDDIDEDEEVDEDEDEDEDD